MSRPSHSKHILFYVTVIAAVLVLFQVVSAYGEANLKAPPNLNGRYLSASAPPGCPEGDRLVLTLQQSGIYVNGTLALEAASLAQNPQNTEATSEEKSSLTGLWKQEQLSLSGETNALTTCAVEGDQRSERVRRSGLQGRGCFCCLYRRAYLQDHRLRCSLERGSLKRKHGSLRHSVRLL